MFVVSILVEELQHSFGFVFCELLVSDGSGTDLRVAELRQDDHVLDYVHVSVFIEIIRI